MSSYNEDVKVWTVTPYNEVAEEMMTPNNNNGRGEVTTYSNEVDVGGETVEDHNIQQ
jgi:hypothetical protein